LTTRRATWPHTPNRHVLISAKTALGTGPVSKSYLNWNLQRYGVSIERIRRDRILHEALTARADPLHLALVFNLSHTVRGAADPLAGTMEIMISLDAADALTSLTAARRLAADLERNELALIEAARAGGATWSQIAAAIGARNRQTPCRPVPPPPASTGSGHRAAGDTGSA
jgi:hypothetical protein